MKAVTFIFFLFYFSGNVFGQNGATISTSESNPSQNQNIPLDIIFDRPTNFFTIEDIQVTNGVISNFEINTPDYSWLNGLNVDSFNVGIGDAGNPEAKINRVVISVDANSDGDIFVLTFGNGIYRIDQNGSKEQIIDGSNLESPLDFAINQDDKFFVADNGQARQIKVFSPTGVYLPEENIGDGTAGNSANNFYGPVGLTFDNEGNLYVADSYSGSDTSEFDRYSIKIYYTNGDYKRLIRDPNANKEIINPYRVAVDRYGNIYVSDSGGDNGRVIIFNSDYDYLDTLEGAADNLGSPGSIVIDDYGFIYIADLGDEVNITQLLNAEDNPEELLNVFPLIRDGIQNDVFNINVYDPERNYLTEITNKIDLPVDLGLDHCGKLLVNNSIFDGTIGSLFGIPIPDIDLDFDIEIFNRLPDEFKANLKVYEECMPAKVFIANNAGVAFDCTPNTESEFEIIWDKTQPIARCVSDFELILVNGMVSISAEDLNDGSTDNCEVESVVIDRSTFNTAGIYPVVMTVTDYAGNEDTCTVQVTVIEDEEPVLDITCIGSRDVNLSNDQPVTVMAADLLNSDTTGLSFNPVSFEFDCSDIGTQNITINATDDETTATDSCVVSITVKDIANPEITCPDNKEENFDPNTGYEVPDFTTEVIVSDNCTSSDDVIITQSPQEGDFITESQVVTITVEDSAGLKDSCTFQLTLEEQQQYELECIGDLTVRLGEDAQNSNVTEIETSEFITSDISNLDLELRVQQFTCEDIGTNSLTIRASDKETGEPYSCTVNVTVVDVGEPLIICPAGVQTREIPASGVYELPDFAEVYSISDNCSDFEDLVFTQDPLPGTEYTEEGDYEIVLTATDVYNNTETCEVTYRLIKSAQPSFECPVVNEIDPIIKNSECDYEVPDYSSLITNFQNFSNTPFISSEYVKNEDFLSVSLEVYDGENGDFVGDCVFEVPAIDNTAPNFDDCTNRNLSITIAEGSFWNLQDFRDDFTATDNCDADLEYTQDPEPGTPINETTDVAVRVTDGSDNTRSCLFTIDVTIVQGNDLILNCPGDFAIFADENCEYRVPDLSEAINVSNDEAIIEQSLEINSIFDNNVDPYVRVTATFEGESVFCDIYLTPKDEVDPVIECPADETINLGDGESYILPDYTAITEATDKCGEVTITQQPVAGTGITEDVDVVVTARDSAGNTTSCDFQVNIVREGEISISCPEDITAAWDENCEFVLPDYTAQAGINSNGEFEIMQTPAPGTIITAAETEVTISVSDNNSNDSCNFILSLEDNTPPALNLKNTSTAIGSDGIALISFADIDNGSFDNCDSEVNYVLSKLTYTCKNLGENLIQVTAEDSNGNISTGTAVVTITDEQGFCDDPVIGSEYIFIYPNPNIGSFKIATPADVLIERVEVFDHRGRFIAAKDYESTVTEYSMNLGPLQEAVYVLKIVTNEKTFTKRFIFKY